MEIQSIFASKALPEAGLGKNVIIDAHRCSDSRMHLRHPSAGRSVFFKTTVQSLLRRLRLIHAIASAAERLRSYGQPGSNPAGEELAYRKIDTGHCFRGTPAWAPRNSFACN